MRAVILLLDVLTWRKKEKKRHKKYTTDKGSRESNRNRYKENLELDGRSGDDDGNHRVMMKTGNEY